MNTVKITAKIRKTVNDIIRLAILYEEEIGRKLGITGEIGEVLVCAHPRFKNLGLSLIANPLSAGFDAIDRSGKRFQIKAKRAVNWEGRYKGRMSSFSKHDFDYAILAILDKSYEIRELYKVSRKKLWPALNRYPRRNPPIAKFKTLSERIL
jgi:hypothetical protein